MGGFSRLRTALVVLAWIGACAQAQPLFSSLTLPGLSPANPVPALQREPLQPPPRYRVIVLAGEGCAGMGPQLARALAHLPHAQLLVLHKPGVDPQAASADCAPGFIQRDSLSRWQESVRAALRADALAQAGSAPLPQLLVGLAEGVDLLPGLAAEVPRLAGLVLLQGSGLDPLEAWQQVDEAQRSDAPDSSQVQGRSLRYWRDLWRWHTARPLLESEWPILQLWGDADTQVPAIAYLRFAVRATGRSAPLCTRRVASGDAGAQQLGIWLEKWALAPEQGLCSASLP
ncbi:alpha/beta hydrolase [Rhodoferax sp.]|uniref:alpha/beta hydrolase n=1 Tax=Rhodoferax sp. TaxID=50421 RepID=UPI00374D3B20